MTETTQPRPIRFVHRAATVQVDCATPPRTVLEWLREDAHCTGTKEGCAEGDCGACTVVVGSLDSAGALVLQPVNACIQLLPTLDGKALFAVEDLAAAGATLHPVGHDKLHPVQQAMVECHGAQCGFCTPGFVMSLWACYERHHAAGTVPTRQQLADDLSGNLCRCTGYRPILDAGVRMFELAPPQLLQRAPVEAALQALHARHADEPLAIDGVFHAPRSVEALAALCEQRPQARLLAGGTDLGLWLTKQLRDLGELVYTGNVEDLRRIDIDAAQIKIGAAATLESAWRALVAEWPVLRDLWLRFASLPIRNAGTMGGNIANGSPIGDSAPVLMALGAHVLLQRGARQRSVALDDFYTGYMTKRLEPGEFMRALLVPRRGAPAQHLRPGQQVLLRAYKISKRFDSDISAVCAGLTIKMSGDRIVDTRLAFGGMAATVQRAAGAEAALRGAAWTEPTLLAAQAALANDFTPLSDMRASAAYRTRVAQNLLRRFWLETRPCDPLPESALSVWARAEAS